MINSLYGFMIAISFLAIAQPIWAQPSEYLYARAEQALAQGSPEVAISIATNLLDEHPNDYHGLILLALGYAKSSEHAAAARAATQAYNAASNQEQRLIAARMVGAELFADAKFTRAEWWLRRAANNTSTVDEADGVRNEFQTIRDANPFSAHVGFSVAPSNNINGGSEEQFFYLGDFLFEFDPESRALSGVEYSGNVDLTYRLSYSQNHITEASLYVYGRTYSLFAASQATVPDVSGSDYSQVDAELSLSHRQYLFEGLGLTGVSASVGRVWTGNRPLWQYYEVASSQNFEISENASAAIFISAQSRVAVDGVQSDAVLYNLQGVYAHRFDNQDRIQLALGYNYNDATDPTYMYSDVSASVKYDLHAPVYGTNLSFEIGGGYKNYDEFTLSLDGRRDAYFSVGATAAFRNVSYFGFSPMVSLSATKTNSNVARYSTLEVQSVLAIQSNF